MAGDGGRHLRFFVAVHVGAGFHSPSNEKAYRRAIKRACLAAASVLRKDDGTCLDAVSAAIQVLEDDPITNAGRGSNLTEEGHVECDASIMDGYSGAYGAVGAVPDQGWDDPYVPRTHEGLLKWKYPEMNSVDFLFEVGSDDRQLLSLYERGKKKLMDGAHVIFRGEEDISSLSGKIIECSWDADAGSWVCMRIRTDKSTPNDINTYRKVMRSITDNITEEVLLNEIAEIVRLPMYADRIAGHRRK